MHAHAHAFSRFLCFTFAHSVALLCDTMRLSRKPSDRTEEASIQMRYGDAMGKHQGEQGAVQPPLPLLQQVGGRLRHVGDLRTRTAPGLKAPASEI